MNIRRKLIRDTVEGLLKAFQVTSAPVPVEKIARERATEVVEQKVEPEISGFLYRDPKNGSAIIGVNGVHSVNRRRFTLAHELGHLLLHVGEGIHVDKMVVRFRDAKSSEGTDSDEIEANAFAAELLMPSSLLTTDLELYRGRDMNDPDVLSSLAKLYRVSTEAMTIRLVNLGYIGF